MQLELTERERQVLEEVLRVASNRNYAGYSYPTSFYYNKEISSILYDRVRVLNA